MTFMCPFAGPKKAQFRLREGTGKGYRKRRKHVAPLDSPIPGVVGGCYIILMSCVIHIGTLLLPGARLGF